MKNQPLSVRGFKGGNLVWLFLAMFLYFYLGLFRNALIDDAFITLRYARTLIEGGTWGFFPGYVANSATSPLNVLLLTSVGFFTGATVDAVILLDTICLTFIAFLFVRISHQITGTGTFGWLATVALLFNPLLISTLGLESIVFTMLFAASIYFHVMKRWDFLAIVLGLLTLTRANGALFILLFMMFLPATAPKIRFVFICLLVLAPWYIFSWIHLGSLVPDTFFIKTDQGAWGTWDFFNGLVLYCRVYPLETILSLFLLPLAVMFFYHGNKNTLLMIGLAGLFHFVGYSLLRVPPFHWYYIPQVVTIILSGSLGLGVAYRHIEAGWKRKILGSIVVIAFLTPPLGMLYMLSREGFSIREMPIHSNWATHEKYREIGLFLKQEHEGEVIRLAIGEIGTLAYYCDCRLLDRFSDRHWLKEYIDAHSSEPGITSLLYKLNFMFYSAPDFPPDDYILRAYPVLPDYDVEGIVRWETSTKWIPQGLIIINKR